MRRINKITAKHYSKEILKYLLSAGAIYIAASSPYFVLRVMKVFERPKFQKRKFQSTFKYLKKRGLIRLEKKRYDIEISLTLEGKKQAKKYQINDLEIERPKKWDKKYRLVIFDIPAASRLIREILRKKLKEWRFYLLQKNFWVHAFECKKRNRTFKRVFGIK